MRVALEEVQRMRGGAQAHLMRCEDEGYYVVKFQNNPQGVRFLANELLGTRLATRLGLTTPPAEVVQVGEELIAHTEDLVMQLGRGRAPCRAGRQAVFFRRAGEANYDAWMIDQGFCFNAGEWNFPDAPLRGLYARHRSVRAVARAAGNKITEAVFEQSASEIPPEWFEFETGKLEQLPERLRQWRKLVRELIVAA